MLKITALILTASLMAGCNQQFAGSAYKVQVGRQVTEFFQDTSTAWTVGAEFRFEAKR